MSYPFPEIEYKVYAKTFLKDVSVFVSFPEIELDKKLEDDLRTYFSEEFNVSGEAGFENDKINSPEGLKIGSSDEYVIFSFLRDAALLKVKFPAYRSFDDISRFFPKLLGYMNILGVSDLITLRITKFNELHFDYKNDSFPIKEIMGHIFSSPLMKEVNLDLHDLSVHPRLERNIDFCDEESCTKANITYGYAKNDFKPKSGSLTLKTSIENTNRLSLSDFENEIARYNNLVDRAYHWCITEDILNSMSN